MSTTKKQPLYNASEIIERFGGIRPMAAKIDTPVTTVQGWKKRDVIPAARRESILKAALDNDVNITDLVTATAPEGLPATSKAKPKKAAVKKKPTKKSAVKKTTTKKQGVKKSTKNKPTIIEKDIVQDNEQSTSIENDTVAIPVGITPILSDTNSDQENKKATPVSKSNQNSIATSVWVTTGLILLAAAIAFFFILPKMKQTETQINQQSQKLVALEQEMSVAKSEPQASQEVTQAVDGFLGASLPANIEEKIDSLQNQARNISVTVDQLSEKAKAISEEALEENTQKLNSKLAMLEAKIDEKIQKLEMPQISFGDFVNKVNGMETTQSGKNTLSNAASQLKELLAPHDSADVETALADIVREDDTLNQTIGGMPKEDLKAAAMLIAFSQFRASLAREESFDSDLELLKKLVGDDNPQLQDNLQRLSVHANDGVLTTQGLSTALKQMTGDIVVSSLNGEDVSIKEKAAARFGDLVQIEKDGVAVTGTETQRTLTRAQEVLDAGKIEESIVLLESLEGAAGQSARPLIEQAKGSLLASRTKKLFEEKILSKINMSASTVSNNLPSFKDIPKMNLGEMKQNFQGFQNEEVIQDENSGMIILP